MMKNAVVTEPWVRLFLALDSTQMARRRHRGNKKYTGNTRASITAAQPHRQIAAKNNPTQYSQYL